MRSEPNPAGPTLVRPTAPSPSGRMTIQISRGGLAVLDLLLAKWRPAVDQQAWDTLMSLDSHAADILQELDLKTDSVNNPSAYIQRAVSNALRGQSVPGLSHGRDPNPGLVTQAPAAQGAHYMVAPGIILDEKATVALQGTAPEIAAQVIAELQTKDPREVRNPSAYVQRALSNAKLKAPQVAVPQEIQSAKNVGSDVSARLDDDARHALQEVSPEAAQHILQLLAEAGDKVHNPSAYVMKAVRNHQEGDRVRNDLSERGVGFVDRGDGGGAEGVVDGAELEEELRLVALDEKAQAALKSLPATSAVQILRNLRKQARQVSNCSAWVVKAVGNATARPPAAAASAYKRQRV